MICKDYADMKKSKFSKIFAVLIKIIHCALFFFRFILLKNHERRPTVRSVLGLRFVALQIRYSNINSMSGT